MLVIWHGERWSQTERQNMAERSRPNKVADGLKATQTKIAQFGPAEPNRAADQAV